MAVYLVIAAGVMAGSDLYLALGAIIGAAAAFGYYRYVSYKQFGGVTGDLAGYFLQICELVMLTGIVFCGKTG